MADVDYGPTSLDELRTLQGARLRQTIAHAYQNSPHYRASFDHQGVRAEDLGSLEDLARFPFTTKADFRASYPFGMMAVPMDRIARVHASSGTTGKPTVVGYTQRDIATWAFLVARSIHAAGGRKGMRAHIAFGYGLFTGGLGAHYGAEALGCTTIPISGGQTERQVQLIGDFAPEIIMVTPSYMLAILDEFRRQGVDPTQSSLKYGIFGAEPWTEAIRSEIESAFNLQATDIYGLSEVMGPGVAQQFVGDAGGPTIWEDHFFPEIVDPDTGEVLPDGTEGELVLTSLTKEALPVIRYRTRDLTRLVPGTRTPMRSMARITGRCDDMLIIRGVNMFPTQIEELVLRCPALAPHFMLEIDRVGRLDAVLIRVESREPMDEAAASREGGRLCALVKDIVGVSAHAVVEMPGSIPRSGGKARRVIDRRKSPATPQSN